MTAKLYYAHDPMCSWCYAFSSAFDALIAKLPMQLDVVQLLGGLAADSDEPMSNETRQFVKANWRRIEQQVPGVTFNYDFWDKCQPRRSTYPASRAVIAAREQGVEFDLEMTRAIQQAYYQQARNPSDILTLIELAVEIGLDKAEFNKAIQSKETDNALQLEIKQSKYLGLNSFPSLLLVLKDQRIRIEPDYKSAEIMLDKIMHYY